MVTAEHWLPLLVLLCLTPVRRGHFDHFNGVRNCFMMRSSGWGPNESVQLMRKSLTAILQILCKISWSLKQQKGKFVTTVPTEMLNSFHLGSSEEGFLTLKCFYSSSETVERGGEWEWCTFITDTGFWIWRKGPVCSAWGEKSWLPIVLLAACCGTSLLSNILRWIFAFFLLLRV